MPSVFNLEANGSIDLTITILPLLITKFGENIPKMSIYKDKLTISPHIDLINPITVNLSGALEDEIDQIIIQDTLSFGDIFQYQKFTNQILFQNPSQRKIVWKLDINEDHKVIFACLGATEGIIDPKDSLTIMITFSPLTAVDFQTEAYLHIDGTVHPILFSGKGVAPQIEAGSTGDNFGVVGISEPEYREIHLTNTTSLPLRLRPRSNNECFIPVEKEFCIGPGETSILHVIFAPTNVQILQQGKITMFHLTENEDHDDIKELDLVPNDFILDDAFKTLGIGSIPRSKRKELQELAEFNFDGMGGNFGLGISGGDVEQESVIDAPGKKSKGSQVININMKFGLIKGKKKYRKKFEVENSGDTTLEYLTLDANSQPFLTGEVRVSKDLFISYSLSPVESKISPRSKDTIVVVIEVLYSNIGN
jgi:hypothetical protein